MSYSTGPYSKLTSLPPPPRPEIHSSRKVDFAHKVYEIDPTTGGFDKMPSVAQTVIMLVSFSVEETRFVTVQQEQLMRERIINALGELINSNPPTIEIVDIEIGSDSAGTGYRRIRFKDLLKGTGIDQTVQLP